MKILVGLFCIICHFTYAQQDSQFTQYMYNTGVINPAYAGSSGSLRVTALHRSQWVGLDRSPSTQTITIDGLMRDNNWGAGISVTNDKLGYSSEKIINIDLSYRVPIAQDVHLAFGVKGGGSLYSLDQSALTFENQTVQDRAFSEDINNKFLLNLGAGLYAFSDNWYAGISSPNLLEGEHYNLTDNQNATTNFAAERMTFYLIGGYVFDLSYDLKFKPATLVKAVKGAPLQLDLSGNFLYRDRFTLGASYRFDIGASLTAGFQVDDNWMIGYAYDKTINFVGDFNSGSHEIFLRYQIAPSKASSHIFSPRFF